MAELTVRDSTSVGLTRLGRPANATADELGPLGDLVGTWIGSHGWELIAVPTQSNGSEGFRLIVRPYIEVLTFSAIGAPVPNRGGPAGDTFVTGLLYDTRITDLETNEPLHLENGMWLYLGEGVEQPISRLASIPHGDALLALGTSITVAGPPEIPSISAIPDAGPDMPLGYTDSYLTAVDGFHPGRPNDVLQQAIAGKDVVQTITLSASTQDGGGIASIPFVASNANATAFSCTFWIETIRDPATGDEVQQLQYSQQTDIEFLPQFGNPGQLIMWPHVNVNTLLKQ
jgi:hypothetical protein